MNPVAGTWLLALAGAVAGVEARGVGVEAVPLEGVTAIARLATASNGQVVFGLDGPRGAVHAIDPFTSGRVREVVSAPGPGVPRPVAIAVVDSGVLAAVCRDADRWELRTWRLLPDASVAADRPLQTIVLGTAPGGVDGEVDVAVGRGRDWIAVSGLPRPLAPVLRAALAGVRVGPLTSRSCPVPGADARPVAVTVGPRDELVIVERGMGVTISYHDATGRCLLRLPVGLATLRDVTCAPSGGALWVAAADDTGTAGVWRLDATMRDGRQAVRPVLVVPRSAPRALVAPTDRAVVLSHGDGGDSSVGLVERIDLPAEERFDGTDRVQDVPGTPADGGDRP